MNTFGRPLAHVQQEFGLDRSNLTRESEAVQEKALHDIKVLQATWFRAVLSGNYAGNCSQVRQRAQAGETNNLKLSANVLSMKADYDEGCRTSNASEEFRNRCDLV